MLFNLNEYLLSISFALDCVEMDILGNRSNHSKRVAYISYHIGKAIGLTNEEIFDLGALSILHDNGIVSAILLPKEESGYRSQDENEEQSVMVDHPKKGKWNASTYNRISQESIYNHCIDGEKNIDFFPFFTDVRNVILYHHENFNGTGFFKKAGDEIPLMSQIIRFADALDNYEVLPSIGENPQLITEFAKKSRNILFSPQIVDIFEGIVTHGGFWLDLKDEFIETAVRNHLPKLSLQMSPEKIYKMTKVYSQLIDAKSPHTQNHSFNLVKKAEYMANYYQMEQHEKYKFMIAASLHDIGKLAISNEILDKPEKLTKGEYTVVQRHVYYTRISLSHISGFEDITEWASNHHEYLDGSGYPYGLCAKELDFNSRLMTCLDVCQALTEDRPYRQPDDNEAINILKKLADLGKLDSSIVNDVLKCLQSQAFHFK